MTKSSLMPADPEALNIVKNVLRQSDLDAGFVDMFAGEIVEDLDFAGRLKPPQVGGRGPGVTCGYCHHRVTDYSHIKKCLANTQKIVDERAKESARRLVEIVQELEAAR